MKGFLVFLATIATATAAGGFNPGLRVRFDVGINIGGSFFFDIPRTIDAAVDEGWVKTRRPRGPLPELDMYCWEGNVFCAMYDDTRYVAGLQIALAKEEFSNSPFDWETRGFTSWNTAVNGQCKRFWTIQQYFVDDDYLNGISKRERLAARERDPDRLLQAGAIWVTGINKELVKISTSEADMVEEGLFTEQACIIWMGKHYYYNMTTSTECTAEQMFPWFPLTKNGELIATGFMTFGQLEHIDNTRDWFERPGETAVRTIVPNGPECLYELADSPGVVTMHIYYVDSPYTIFC